jgi:hypothetical protein
LPAAWRTPSRFCGAMKNRLLLKLAAMFRDRARGVSPVSENRTGLNKNPAFRKANLTGICRTDDSRMAPGRRRATRPGSTHVWGRSS